MRTDAIVIGLAFLYCKGTKKDPIEVAKEWDRLAYNLNPRLKQDLELDQSTNIKEEDIEEVYGAYPTRDPLTGRSTGKSQTDKSKIARLLGCYTKDDLVATIKEYLANCAQSNTYIKNFSTFLNNIPDTSEVKPKVVESYWQ